MFRNDEIPFIIEEVIENIINKVLQSCPSLTNFQMSITSKSFTYYKLFVDNSLNSYLLAYCLLKYVTSINTDNSTLLRQSSHLPLLSGFFATYLTLQNRSTHSIRFCTPIKENPNDIATIETCLRDAKAALLESKHQKVAVLVIDEKLYQGCSKVK
jgi:hypothetical protein